MLILQNHKYLLEDHFLSRSSYKDKEYLKKYFLEAYLYLLHSPVPCTSSWSNSRQSLYFSIGNPDKKIIRGFGIEKNFGRLHESADHWVYPYLPVFSNIEIVSKDLGEDEIAEAIRKGTPAQEVLDKQVSVKQQVTYKVRRVYLEQDIVKCTADFFESKRKVKSLTKYFLCKIPIKSIISELRENLVPQTAYKYFMENTKPILLDESDVFEMIPYHL